MGDAVQREQPGAVLPAPEVRGGGARSGRSARSRSRRCGPRRNRSSTPAPPPSAGCSTPAPNSGGGWFLEQWFARAGELYADNDNGRSAPATEVLFDSPTGVELMTFVQDMINDGLAVSVGDNAERPGHVLEADRSGRRRGDDDRDQRRTRLECSARSTAAWRRGSPRADVGVGPMPGPEPRTRREPRWRLAVDRRRQGRREGRRGVGLHHLPDHRRGPVAVGLADGVRARCAATRSTSSRC